MTPPPQEINEAVARKLGWEKRIDLRWHRNDASCRYCPDYSGSIEAAWEILGHVRSWTIGKHYDEPEIYMCVMMNNETPIYIEADTAPMAICLAFLKLTEEAGR